MSGNYEKLLIHYKRYILGFEIIIISPRKYENYSHLYQ